jgi:acyl carrier protein
MNYISSDDVRRFLRSHLLKKSKAQGKDIPSDLPDDCDLLLSGIIDSLGLLELIVAVSEYFSREIDFEALDPEEMTVVGPLCKFLSEQLRE